METTFRKSPSGVVINTNKSGYKEARRRKQKRLEEEQRINNLETDIKDLKGDISKILQLLQEK